MFQYEDSFRMMHRSWCGDPLNLQKGFHLRLAIAHVQAVFHDELKGSRTISYHVQAFCREKTFHAQSLQKQSFALGKRHDFLPSMQRQIELGA